MRMRFPFASPRGRLSCTWSAIARLIRVAMLSVAALIREGVEFLLRGAPEGGEAGRRQRALAAAGRFRSDRTDLATEHDRYLDDAFSR